jgi:hypothetical protein
MAAPYPFNRYYFTADTFNDIVHDIERYPELPPLSATALARNVAQADVTRWIHLFNVTADEATYEIRKWRATSAQAPPASDATLKLWP